MFILLSHVQVPLDVPSAAAIKKTGSLAESTRSMNGGDSDGEDGGTAEGALKAFGGPLPAGSPCPFKQALWACTQTFVRYGHALNARYSRVGSPPARACACRALISCFLRCGGAACTKRIFLFTNDDDPLAGLPDEQDRAVQVKPMVCVCLNLLRRPCLTHHVLPGSGQVARDAAESGVEMQLFALARPGQDFDASRFFFRVLVVNEEEDAGTPADRVRLTSSPSLERHRARALPGLLDIIFT